MQYGSDDLAKYTFLPQAGDFIRSQGIELSDLARADFRNVLMRARERVVDAIEKGRVSDKVASQKEIEIMSFPVAMILVRSTNLDNLMEIYSRAEAARVERFLKAERNPKLIEDILSNYAGIVLQRSAYSSDSIPSFEIPLIEYAKRSKGLRDPRWRLVNRVVAHGKVLVSQDDLIQLIREEIRATILARLTEIKIGKLPDNLQTIVQELTKLAPPPRNPFATLNVGPENYPPCVREALRLLENGQNVPHYGRFLLTTYLLRVGKSVDDIVALFPKAPDFRQNVTRYQVEHIAGLKGGRTHYSVPSCKTLQTHSFCFMDPVKCYGISSPLQFPSRKSQLKSTQGGSRVNQTYESRRGEVRPGRRKTDQWKTSRRKS